MTKIHNFISRKKKLSSFCLNDLGECYCASLRLDSTIFEGVYPTTQQLVCSAVSEESVRSGCITSIPHTISHDTTLASIHFRLVQDISCCVCVRVTFLVRLHCMTILWTAFRLVPNLTSHRSTLQACRYPHLRATNKLRKHLRVKP
jgi:hypothetical protein